MLHASSRRLKPLCQPRSRLSPWNLTRFSPLSGVPADGGLLDSFDHLLRQCRTAAHPRQVHCRIVVDGAQSSPFLAARLVSAYGRFGLLASARGVFDEMPPEWESNILLWNSVIRAYVTNECFAAALSLYSRMRKVGALGDGFTFPLVIRASAMADSLNSNLGRMLHCESLLMGFHDNLHVGNELIGMYGKLGRMDVACQVFDRMPVKSQVSWNTMLSGFSRNFDSASAVEMFHLMESEGMEPNLVTWTSLLSSHARCGQRRETFRLFGEMMSRGIGCNPEALAVVLSVCADSSLSGYGSIVHGVGIKTGCEDHLIVHNALISVYGKLGDIEGAKRIFSEIKAKTIVSWNSMITSYAECGFCTEAYELFSQLEELSMGCSMVKPNVVSWSAVINGFASAGRGREALELFRRMQLAKVEPNTITIASMLSVCADLAALNLGREIHGIILRALMDSNILVGNSLISMYMKCGSLREGVQVFEMLNTTRDLISWNSIIAGYGMHGHGRESLKYFDRMVQNRFQPDKVTFIAVLSACSHSGLVTEGHSLFNRMHKEFGVKPGMEHYACVVDLLSRFGSLEEATAVVKSMPFEPNACVLGALLNAYQMHRQTGMKEETTTQIFSSNTDITGSYMLLSNIYALNGRWDDSARVRVSAREKGLKKVTGQSWIELKQKVYMFSAGDASSADSAMEDVYRILEELMLQMDSSKLHVPFPERTQLSID